MVKDNLGPPDDGNDDRFIAHISGALRRPERCQDETFESRLMAAVRASAAAAGKLRPSPRMGWWQRSVTVRITPIRAIALAAAIAGVAFLGAMYERVSQPRAAVTRMAAATRGASLVSNTTRDTVYMVRFVLVAPRARSVSLVGDFNNWNKTVTQLTPLGENGTWMAVVPLTSNRHEYAFIVDGTKWMADPNAPSTLQDDFGTTSSFITVGTRTG